MTSVAFSLASKNNRSDQIIDDVTKRSCSKILQLEGTVDEDLVRTTWSAFGLYISRQMRMGRGIKVPKFGVFSFSVPEIELVGTTNENQRDKQPRLPVFIVGKDFVKGKSLKSAIYSGGNVRPYSVYGLNGIIQENKANYTEIGHYANIDKDYAKLTVERILRQLADRTKANENFQMDIPNVGIFIVKNGMVTIAFSEYLLRETKIIAKKPIEERKQKGDMSLNNESLKKFDLLSSLGNVYDDKDANFLYIDDKAKEYMQRNLNINVDDIVQRRPATAASRSVAKFSQHSKLGDNWMEAKPSQVHQRPTTAAGAGKSKSVNKERTSEAELSLKALTYWIRSNNLASEDAYIELCNKGLGYCTDKAKLTHETFYKAIINVGINLSPLEANSLFDLLDVNQDGFVDFNDWEETIKEEGNRLQYIKDVIFRNNLKVDDVLKRMNLTREQGSVTCLELKEALKKMDEDLDDKQALKLAKSILRNREFLEVDELIDLLECFEEDGTIYNINWFKNMLVKIKRTLEAMADPLILRKEFENYDRLNKGILDIANFKTCFRKVKLGLSVKEINRFVRYIEKDDPSTVDYYHFLRKLDEVSAPAKENFVFRNLTHFAESLNEHLKKNKLTPITFIKKILNAGNQNPSDDSGLASSSRINPEAMAFYIQQQVFVQSSMEELGIYVQQIDVDKDGFINETDLESFLKRYQYIDNPEYVENTTLSTRTKGFFAKSVKSFPNLYPTKPLSNEKADVVLRDIRQALYLKKYSFLEFFRILDINQDGFITIGEFCQAIDKFVKFSQPIKEGFFAYMDKQKIGMINYSTFLETMNKSLFIESAKVSDDNFEWVYETIDRIRAWFNKEGLSVEDAFRSADKDFDGRINKEDLKLFLTEVIKIREEDLNAAKLDRLFKLMDQFKRGLVQLNDFKRILTEEMGRQRNMTILGGKTFHGKTSFDWIMNAKQQIGLVLSRNFKTLKESFEGISGHSKKILYSQFEKWVEESRALFGFDLTEKLLQHVFSDCDPHKKGYLTENDWLNSFGGYNWTNQMVNELKESLQNNFKNLDAAFHFFCQNAFSTEITFEKFREGVNLLFPKRFTFSDITIIWNKLKNGSSNLSYSQFTLLFDKKASAMLKASRPKTAGMVLESNKSLYGKTLAANGPGDNQEVEETDIPVSAEATNINEVVEKVKQIMRAANKPPEVLFKEIDIDGSGSISNLEFRNCIKKMKLGLTSKEIDLLMNSCDENLDGKVDINEFVKKFKTTELGKRILDRSKQRLQKIRDDIFYFMLSPKDAFLTFNEDRTGKLTFDQFHQFMLKLCQLSGEDMLPFSILKDLFEFIDIRKDGVIDMNEWLQSFIMEKDEQKPAVQGKAGKRKLKKQRPRPATSLPKFENGTAIIQTSSGMRKIINDSPDYVSPIYRQGSATNINAYNSETIQESSKWQTSKEYDLIIKTIARNRKYLLDVFNDHFKRAGNVSYDKVKEVLEGLLRFNGIMMQEKYWPYLLKFAIKDGNIDFKFLLEVYKERVGRVDSHPRLVKNL